VQDVNHRREVQLKAVMDSMSDPQLKHKLNEVFDDTAQLEHYLQGQENSEKKSQKLRGVSVTIIISLSRPMSLGFCVMTEEPASPEESAFQTRWK